MPGDQGSAKELPHTRYGLKIWYLFTYNLIQFCGYSWISTNITARFLTFGEDSLVDTYHSIGAVMCFCQLLSILELIHVLTGIEQSPFLPRFLQVTERNIILFVVITSQEEMQSKHVVWALFSLWGTLDVMKYPYRMLSVIGTDLHILSWIHHHLWIPLFPSIVLTEVIAIYQSLPYFEALGTYSFLLPGPIAMPIHFPYVLQLYCVILVVGMYSICRQLYEELRQNTRRCTIKVKQN
ncbi:very-long-chain (3R)-3-hydroxyacyl-CoA dehydratase 4 [Carcharodon carcharias]|uniref:very-long-chain (3R)-3-hydroxyacyl-CoA dehydratase 4 n=1 Tax=Carcharodon carcharias TaxID=13397 RepID=UPI001B7DEB42|nr:very-long-chain (3R)-3-hydroxyacyl-CoA dehydratase 4 [Carcharodon carcharias]